MDSTNEIKKLIYVLIVLMTANFGLNIYNTVYKEAEIKKETISEKTLPKYLKQSVINELSNKIVEYSNNFDIDNLYDQFGPIAQAQFDKKELKNSLELMSSLGKVIKIVYTHHQYLNSADGGDYIHLHHKAKFENGNGTIRITVLARESNFEVVGFHFNVPKMEK